MKLRVEAERPRTDWARVDALTDEDIATSIRDDPDVAPELDAGGSLRRRSSFCKPKEQISIRLDRDVLEHFRRYPRYQTRINVILRAAMEHERRLGKDPPQPRRAHAVAGSIALGSWA